MDDLEPGGGPWVEAGATLVHIGLPKTGTTAIQGALAAARPRLAVQGVVYPGEERNHFSGAAALVDLQVGAEWGSSQPYTSNDRWDALMATLATTRRPSDRTVISAECLIVATTAQIERVVADLGPARVVVTVRPLERALPATWQQQLRRGQRVDLETWARSLLEEQRGWGEWTGHPESFDVPSIVDRWAAVVSLDRVAVLLPGGPRAVPDAFESFLGLPPGTLQLTGEVDANRSFTAEESEAILGFNRLVDRDLVDFELHNQRVQYWMLERLTRRTPLPTEHRLALPAPLRRRCREVDRRHRAWLEGSRAAGLVVVGDLDALAPEVDDALPDPTSVPEGEVAAIAARDAGADIAAWLLRNAVETMATKGPIDPPPPPGQWGRWVPPLLLPTVRRAKHALGRVTRSR